MATINTFGCVTLDNYTFKQNITRNCFGNKSVRGYNLLSITMFFETALDTKNFANWYFNTISGGAIAFDITIPILGVTKDWNVIMVTDISHTLLSASGAGKISFSVKTTNYIDNQFI